MHWLQSHVRQLRYLTFHRSVRLSAAQELLLHPPSALLPALSSFSYFLPPQ